MQTQIAVDFDRYVARYARELRNADKLTPIFEAVSNAFYAIDDARKTEGKIVVELISDGAALVKGAEKNAGFRVRDDGIGFDDDNLESFRTLCSARKAGRGGKGVGRVSWLVAFEKVVIRSVFRAADGSFRERVVRFSTESGNEIAVDESATDAARTGTVVELVGVKKSHRALKNMTAQGVADALARGFYPTLTSRPGVAFYVERAAERVDVRAVAQGAAFRTQTQHVGNETLQIDAAAFASRGKRRAHQVVYCADGRAVEGGSDDFERVLGVPYSTPFEDADGKAYFATVYVASPYFDRIVDESRTRLEFPLEIEEASNVAAPTRGDVESAVGAALKRVFGDELKKADEKKRRRVDAFFKKKPRYRFLRAFAADVELARANAKTSDEELERAMQQAYLRLDVEQRRSFEAFAKIDPKNMSAEEIERRFHDFAAKIEAAKAYDLSAYVARRKFVLETLEILLSKQGDEKYAVESKIHELIYPMRTTSNDAGSVENNLWLIDEKLIPYGFVSSDKPLRELPNVRVDSAARPDLLAFDNPLAFAIERGTQVGSVAIVEFKRPMRDDYRDDEDPISQVVDYALQIREGVLDANGRAFKPYEKARIYCYVVADLTPSLIKKCVRASLHKTHDDLGYFVYNEGVNAYVEVVSYEKLLADAKSRNAEFFRRLGFSDSLFY